MMGTGFIAQIDPAVVEHLDRISTMQTVIGISIIIMMLVAAAVGIAAVFLILQARKQLKEVQETFRRLSPRLEPAVDRTRHILDDVGDTVEAVRGRVDEVTETMGDLTRSLRAAAEEAEVRVREFGAVLGVVQEEAQDMLLESAATARGIHTTAAALRGVRRPGLPKPDGTGDASPAAASETRRVTHAKG